MLAKQVGKWGWQALVARGGDGPHVLDVVFVFDRCGWPAGTRWRATRVTKMATRGSGSAHTTATYTTARETLEPTLTNIV